MDLSVNNKNFSNKNISFKGFDNSYNEKGEQEFKVYIPPICNKDGNAKIEYVPYNKETKVYNYIWSRNIPQGTNTYTFDQSDVNHLFNKGYDGLLYRFRIGDEIKHDETEKITVKNEKGEDEVFNIVKIAKSMGTNPKPGTQYHVFVDSNVSPEYLRHLTSPGELGTPKGNLDFVHNHFNKLGGTIKGLDYLLTKTDELEPYRYIISTPDIGKDPTSSHRYWPNNIYQCTDMEAFKDLNFHCFERGKGYVADGAFTSQSLQSPIVQHALKWGSQSPWSKMLKIEGSVALGILPDNEEAKEHIGVKIVNNPNQKGSYRPGEPTYIQFFDDRLVSQKLISEDKLIEKTDKIPEDHYDFTSNNDSAYMFSFTITPSNTDQLKVFKDANSNFVMLKDIANQEDFLKLGENYSITTRNQASGANYWDGNKDMIKMNLSNSNYRKEMKQAREYVANAATFWTESIQSDLILRTAKASDKEKAQIAKNNGVNYKTLKANISSENTVFPVLEQNRTISDYLREFPLQSIETDPDLSPIFAQPDFNKELLTSQDLISRMETAVDEVLDYAIPDKYKQTENGKRTKEFEQYKQYAIKTYAPLIIKTLFAGALNEDTILSDGTIDYQKLGKISLRGIEISNNCLPSTAKEEKKVVLDFIKNGYSKYALKGTKDRIKEELKDISLEDFKLADAIVLQGKGGLNWRFDAAKDIGDLDAVRDTKVGIDSPWNDVRNFWLNFVSNVKKYNPSSLVINEVTDLNELIEKSKHIGGDPAFEEAKAKENLFLADTGSTTSSNYIFFFHKLACFVGTNTEKMEGGKDNNPEWRAGNLDALRGSILDFMKQNQPGNVYFSHSFVENHDKPRVLHTLPLDLELFHTVDIKGNPDYEKLARELTGSEEYSRISPKALAVAQMMNEQIEKDYAGEEKEQLKEALAELTLGKKTKTSPVDFKRSEAFGVTPYEISIRDLFKKAGLTDDLDDRVLDFHSSMLSKAMSQQTSLWEMMNAIPGTPTIFNGAEFAQTGWEQKNKNETQANRNQILHYLKNDKRYSKYYNKMQAISGLYKLKGLSAIRDGAKEILNTVKEKEKKEKPSPKAFTDLSDERRYIIDGILRNGGYEAVQKFLEKHPTDEQSTYDALYEQFGIWHNKDCYDRFIAETKDENFKKLLEACEDYPEIYKENEKIRKENAQALQLLPIYSYNKKGDEVLQFITNYNVSKGDLAYKAELESPKEKDAIFVKDIPLQEGTILRRKVYKSGTSFSDETTKNSKTAPQKYIVHNSTIYPAILKNGKYVADENKKININDTVLTFYKNKEDN